MGKKRRITEREENKTLTVVSAPKKERPLKRSRRKIRVRRVEARQDKGGEDIKDYVGGADEATGERLNGYGEDGQDGESVRGEDMDGEGIGYITPDVYNTTQAQYHKSLEKLFNAYSDLSSPRLYEFAQELAELTTQFCTGEHDLEDKHVEGDAEDGSAQLLKHGNSSKHQPRIYEKGSHESNAHSNDMTSLRQGITLIKQQHVQQMQKHNHALKALQSETSALRQEMQTIRLQREQQRQWNKNAMKYQADIFHDEMNLVAEQLRSQERLQKEFKNIHAEVAELKARLHEDNGTKSLRHGTQLSQPDPAKHMRSKDHRFDTKPKLRPIVTAPPPSQSPRQEQPLSREPEHVDPPPHILNQVNLIKTSIEERHRRWSFFLSQKSNYMFAPNLENGLADILREIRHFNIHNNGDVPPTTRTMIIMTEILAFDLVLLTVRELYLFTVAVEGATQDPVSVPAKLKAWEPMDEFAAMLLRGLGWRYDGAERARVELEGLRRGLEWVVKERGLEGLEVGDWFCKTSDGLEQCLERKSAC